MGINQLFEKPALTPRETGPEMSNLLNILFSRKIAHAYTDKKQQQNMEISILTDWLHFKQITTRVHG